MLQLSLAAVQLQQCSFHSLHQQIEETRLDSKCVHQPQRASRKVFPKSVVLPFSGHQQYHSSQPRHLHSVHLAKRPNMSGCQGSHHGCHRCLDLPGAQSPPWLGKNDERRNVTGKKGSRMLGVFIFREPQMYQYHNI